MVGLIISTDGRGINGTLSVYGAASAKFAGARVRPHLGLVFCPLSDSIRNGFEAAPTDERPNATFATADEAIAYLANSKQQETKNAGSRIWKPVCGCQMVGTSHNQNRSAQYRRIERSLIESRIGKEVL